LFNQNDEAVYILDHLNGNLQCWVINNRTNELGGVYRTNVYTALGGGKEGQDSDLVMTTGSFEFNPWCGATGAVYCLCCRRSGCA